MSWIFYVLAAAAALAAADILVKTAAGRIQDSLGMLLYGAVPFVTGLIWYLTSRNTAPVTTIKGSPAGLAWA